MLPTNQTQGLGRGAVPAAGVRLGVGGPRRLRASGGRAHRGAVVVVENLLVEVVKEFLFQLKHHLQRSIAVSVGRTGHSSSSAPPLPDAGWPPGPAALTAQSSGVAYLPVIVRLTEYQLHDLVGVGGPHRLHRGLCAESLRTTETSLSPGRGAHSPGLLNATRTLPGLPP